MAARAPKKTSATRRLRVDPVERERPEQTAEKAKAKVPHRRCEAARHEHSVPEWVASRQGGATSKAIVSALPTQPLQLPGDHPDPLGQEIATSARESVRRRRTRLLARSKSVPQSVAGGDAAGYARPAVRDEGPALRLLVGRRKHELDLVSKPGSAACHLLGLLGRQWSRGFHLSSRLQVMIQHYGVRSLR